ncbi:thiamine phosphate synthase [Spirosoma sp.]|uniref:thiamine phosphate synthase n=1 Tax=Spirosoma sp. TaxID=1899569 RepID=UPI00261622CA|nr:thiamine phosphate synthase [Spirosoma sp.]MCX6218820.1 thiamine phosphate synthase [Spirosoma sp.]
MNKNPFLLVGITDGSPQSLDIPTIQALLTGGLDFLYWRAPADSAGLTQLSAGFQSSVLLPATKGSDVPASFRWHLKDTDRQAATFIAGFPFSTSVHALSEWPKLAGQVDMVFYSPLFPSISKPGYGPSSSLEIIGQEVSAIRQRHKDLPRLIGLGGIQAENVALVRRAGFDGVALMGALWQAPDAVDALNQIRKALSR